MIYKQIALYGLIIVKTWNGSFPVEGTHCFFGDATASIDWSMTHWLIHEVIRFISFYFVAWWLYSWAFIVLTSSSSSVSFSTSSYLIEQKRETPKKVQSKTIAILTVKPSLLFRFLTKIQTKWRLVRNYLKRKIQERRCANSMKFRRTVSLLVQFNPVDIGEYHLSGNKCRVQIMILIIIKWFEYPKPFNESQTQLNQPTTDSKGNTGFVCETSSISVFLEYHKT